MIFFISKGNSVVLYIFKSSVDVLLQTGQVSHNESTTQPVKTVILCFLWLWRSFVKCEKITQMTLE